MSSTEKAVATSTSNKVERVIILSPSSSSLLHLAFATST
jgi:hypothetical protein